MGIKTVKFVVASSYENIIDGIKQLRLPVVIKTSRFGYDGKGQKIINQKEEIDKVASQFNNVPVIIEEMIDFELEMSVIICRDMDGKISAYDPSENVHQNGILIESKVPANISLSIASDAIIIASKIIRNLEYIGTMGIEFFLTKSKQLLVNEMAPRVHNSGHWTQSGCIISQFEQHIRAITGNSIGDGKRHSNIMMKNILGEDIYNIRYDSESSLNIYGKDEAKLNRKMGHSNIIK
jgi:5-(carboxyamino)imidazole ribonucleotide synthase